MSSAINFAVKTFSCLPEERLGSKVPGKLELCRLTNGL